MFTIRRTSKTECPNAVISVSRHVSYKLIFASTVLIGMAGLTGCGQKGDLYLVDSSSKVTRDSTAIVDSGNNPQDTAFAGIDDNENVDDFKLPEPSDDPNDY